MQMSSVDYTIRTLRRREKMTDIELEDIKCDICCNYCKYPEIWNEEAQGMELSESEHCQNCPLNKL